MTENPKFNGAFDGVNVDSVPDRAQTQFHPSAFARYRYAYPVVSRRAGGVSLGVNLSQTQACNFRCVYCEVDRGETKAQIARALETISPDEASSRDVTACARRPEGREIDMEVFHRELRELIDATLSGELFKVPRFADVPARQRVLRDVAFSGDGEPTASKYFPEAVKSVVRARQESGYEPLKLILITNATRLQRPEIVAALDEFCAANGEIWAKLDAGNSALLKTINRTAVPLETILENLLFAAKRWRVKLQTALFEWRGRKPSEEDFGEYCARVREILDAGGRFVGAQLYTVARKPAEKEAVPLSEAELDDYARRFESLTGLSAEVFYSK